MKARRAAAQDRPARDGKIMQNLFSLRGFAEGKRFFVYNSFGAEATWDHCGALYRQTPSQYNASLEPGVWQTYDIIYTPAKFDGDKCVEYPKFTVYHNGKRVQHETPVPYSTSIGPKDALKFKHPNTPLQIQLQDHLNPVSYRNIWIQEL